MTPRSPAGSLFYLLYVREARRTGAHARTRTQGPDAWTSGTGAGKELWQRAVPDPWLAGVQPDAGLDVLAPVLDISAAPRGVRLRVRSPRQVQVVYLYVRPEADVQRWSWQVSCCRADHRPPGTLTARR